MKNKKLVFTAVIIVVVIVVAVLLLNNKSGQNGNNFLANILPTPDTVSYEAGNLKYTITKDDTAKTATVLGTYALTDNQEWYTTAGKKYTLVPALVNFGCAMINNNFYDPAANDTYKKDKNIPAKYLDQLTAVADTFNTKLGTDFKVTDFTVNYLDAATTDKIASCESKQKGNASIHFTIFNAYTGSPSAWDTKMGVYPDN